MRIALRKIKYLGNIVLTSKTVYEGISSILESLRNSDLEGAKRKLDQLSPEVKGERERGSIMAAAGIYTGMLKGKDGSIQSWDPDRIRRAATTVKSSQMADDFDRGFAETLQAYADLIQRPA